MKFKITGYKGKPTPTLADLNKKAGRKAVGSFKDLQSAIEVFTMNDVTPPRIGEFFNPEELSTAVGKVIGSQNFRSIGLQDVTTCELYLILVELLNLESWASKLLGSHPKVIGPSHLHEEGICSAIEEAIRSSTCFKSYNYVEQLVNEVLKFKALSTFKSTMTVLTPVWVSNIYGHQQDRRNRCFPINSPEIGVSNEDYFRYAQSEGSMYEGQYGEDRKDLLKFLCHHFYDIV